MAEIDLVGFVERMRPTVLQPVDVLGLQHMPFALYSNKALSNAQSDTHVWTSLCLAVRPPPVADKQQLSPAMHAWNNCSSMLFQRWLARFDTRVVAMPLSFHESLTLVSTERPTRVDARGELARSFVEDGAVPADAALAQRSTPLAEDGEGGAITPTLSAALRVNRLKLLRHSARSAGQPLCPGLRLSQRPGGSPH